MSDPKPFFLQGRRCPDDKFRVSLVWRLRAKELEDDAAFAEQLDLDDARLFSVFAISNAEREQERGAAFTPGPCQSEYLARLQGVDHSPTDALDGLIAAGIEDLSRAHATQLRAVNERKPSEKRRGERHPKATRVRPLTFPRQPTRGTA